MDLFIPDKSGFNSIQDPPNGVLVNDNEEKTYEIIIAKYDGEKAIFEMLYIGASDTLGEFNGQMSLFVDSGAGIGQQVNDTTGTNVPGINIISTTILRL